MMDLARFIGKQDLEREKVRVKRMQDLIGGWGRFDVFVSTDVDDWAQIEPRLPLFNAISDMIEETGHKAFMPHEYCFTEDGKRQLDERDSALLVNYMMVPRTSLFLGYLGFPSQNFIGTMIGQAMLRRRKIVFFYEKGLRLETVQEVRNLVIGARGLDHEYDPEILRSPRVFYHHDHPHEPLRPYKKMEGVVRFESANECVEKLRGKVTEIVGEKKS